MSLGYSAKSMGPDSANSFATILDAKGMADALSAHCSTNVGTKSRALYQLACGLKALAEGHASELKILLALVSRTGNE